MTAQRRAEPRRRWVLRGRGPHPGPIDVQVVAGQVLVDAPRGRAELDPQDVERLREALDQARAVAIWDRGRW